MLKLKLSKVGVKLLVVKECLVLYDPKVEIPFYSTIQELVGILNKYDFKLTTFEDRAPIYHGRVWVTDIDKVAIHFYISEKSNYLESFMMTGGNYNNIESLLDTYHRKQNWLESFYGKGKKLAHNINDETFNYKWEFDNFYIEHFIKDRFGPEEGIYFNLKK